jgi:hypothetical protein
MFKKSLFSLLALSFHSLYNAQNVSVNSTGATAHTSAMLDVDDAAKGMLVPRVALTALNASLPITGILPNSLLVFNTATNILTVGNEVYPGYYYWDLSNLKWIAIAGSGSKNWCITGNANTLATANFIGTTDNVDLLFKVNSIKGGQINISGNRTMFGYQAGLATTGDGNSFFGSQAGKLAVSGTFNTAVGYGAFRASAAASSENTHIGTNAGANWNTAAARGNTSVGMSSLQGVATSNGTFNSALGYAAGSGFILGTSALNGFAITTGNYNTFLGYSSAMNAGSYSNSTAVGSFSLFDASNVIVLGSISGVNQATATTNTIIGRTSNFGANIPMVYTSGALQIETSSADRNGIYVRNTGTGGSAGIGSYSENYIGVYGTTKSFFGMYAGAIGATGTVYGFGATTNVNGSGIPVVTTPAIGSVGVSGSSNGATAYGAYFANTNSFGWAIYSEGTAGKAAGTTWTVSDSRLKKDILPMGVMMSKIMNLRPVTYNFKPEYGISDGLKLGFISQEVEAVFPELVREKPLPTPYQTAADGTKTLAIDQARPETAKFIDMESLTPVIIKALQEQQMQIEALKEEIRKLKEGQK